MSGLQNFLAPFSHLVFSNRNLVIFFLCVVLFLAALDALIHRWKAQRLDRDLSVAKSGAGVANSGRRYATAPTAEEPPREQGGPLPPIKGGRTYARNLGSALQKAGVPTSQIYSPPTPPGWATNTNPGQPGQPAAPPYTAQPTPWGAPAVPQTPWAFQGGPGRPAQGPAPSAAPLYQPQPGASAPMPQPSTPSMPGPGVFSPPSQAPGTFAPPPPYGQPAFPAPATGSSVPPPSFAPPAPSMSPTMPAFPAPSAPEPAAPDGGRRGKPKRRRFNFNVLENLEKMVQPKPAEPVPTSSWTPPPAPPAAAPAPSAASLPFAAQPPVPPTAPAAPAASTDQPSVVAKPASPEAPTLPFQFAPQMEAKASPVAEQPAEDVAPAPATEEESRDVAPSAPPAGPSISEPDTNVEPEPEQKTDARRSMRSMMFGEEVAAPEIKGTAPAEPEVKPAPAPEQEPAATADADSSTPAVEPSWPSYSWHRDEEASSSTADVATPESPTPSEPAQVDVQDAQPVAESTSSDAFDPWTPSYTAEPEATTEALAAPDVSSPAAEAAESATSQQTGEPADVSGGTGNAGTLVIIEDDATAASYYATLFRGNGYRVEVANDGVSGVDLATRMQPQVILLDVMMPRQNGILVLQTLRASDETKNTPVVVMSNFSEPTLIKRALQLGALEYVIKTQVEGPALLSALPRWMNREKAFAAA